MTWYITISAPGYAEGLETGAVIRFLQSGFNLVMRPGVLDLVNQDSVNSLSVIVAETDERGCYAILTALPERINMIELVCWNDEPVSFYEDIAVRIARHLNWYARVENPDDKRDIWVT